jgi:hypothetical protein
MAGLLAIWHCVSLHTTADCLPACLPARWSSLAYLILSAATRWNLKIHLTHTFLHLFLANCLSQVINTVNANVLLSLSTRQWKLTVWLELKASYAVRLWPINGEWWSPCCGRFIPETENLSEKTLGGLRICCGQYSKIVPYDSVF